MPARGTHFTGPVRHAPKREQAARSWFSELVVGANDPDYVSLYLDFVKATDYSTSDWTLGGTGTPTAAVGTTTNTNGLWTLTTTNTSGDSNNIQGKQDSWALDTSTGGGAIDSAGKRLWFEVLVKPSNVADVDFFCGLSEIQSDILGSSGNLVGFRMTNGAATVSALTVASSTTTTVATGQSLSTTAYKRLGFRFYQGNRVDFYIDGLYVGQSSTNLPTAGMAPGFVVKTNSANARSVIVDYLFIAKER